MTGRSSTIRKYLLFVQKICGIWKTTFSLNDFWKSGYFSLDFEIGCAAKFHASNIFFLSISVRSKFKALCVKTLSKLNILSVITID